MSLKRIVFSFPALKGSLLLLVFAVAAFGFLLAPQAAQAKICLDPECLLQGILQGTYNVILTLITGVPIALITITAFVLAGLM
ncbi:MAG: hypothetical protein HYT50_00690, partial [Candidatus Wildermuthbacteria bacterium]|nr:hypothetical protein [Candidatus Wildermuthbacteria bacterium]